jgi:demethylmenaquinone methyltransferase/2-methoxy-6-polyprenyl-1,4-benzoquinol methylase
MFDEIASTYDIANRVLSFGVDKSWRKVASELTYKLYDKNEIELIADVACGTGDMIENWLKVAQKKGIVVKKGVGIDPSVGMLEVARKRGLDVEFIEGEAKALPLKDSEADIVSISYGLRNVVDRVEGLKEFHRVLKDGGMLVILEFTKLKDATLMSKIRDFYMKKVLPLIGGFLSKNYEAYSYLPNSIDNFLTKESLVEELKECGFKVEFVKGFSMDISTLFIARKV